MADLFSTGVLTRVVAELNQPKSFLLDRFFPQVQLSDTEEIHFDVDKSKPRITPFVAPVRAGRVVANEGYTTRTFQPAYAKDKRIFDPNDPVKIRAIGEPIGGNTLSPMQRREINLNRALTNQLQMLTRREEVMASEALRLGQVTVSGDGYPTTVVSFARDAALTVTLAGNDRWSVADVASNPLEDLENWATLIQDKSGAVAVDVVLEPTAFQNFRTRLIARNEAAILFDFARSGGANVQMGPSVGDKARFVGVIGNLHLWVYQDTYIDEAGVTQKIMPTGTVIMGSSQVEGVRAYGVIRDEEAGYEAMRFFTKSWLEKDPAVRYLLLQSAPLVVPYRPDASLCATVL